MILEAGAAETEFAAGVCFDGAGASVEGLQPAASKPNPTTIEMDPIVFVVTGIKLRDTWSNVFEASQGIVFLATRVAAAPRRK